MYKNNYQPSSMHYRMYGMASSPLIRPPQRLVFPIRQNKQDYVGKKQYQQKNKDNVSLQSPDHTKYLKRDKLDISDIPGTKPKSIQAIRNVERARESRVRQHFSEKKMKTRSKTQIQDSLDKYIVYQKQSPKLQHQQLSKKYKQLLQKNLQLTKQHILGIGRYQKYDKRANLISEDKNPISPTYLSTFNT